MKRIVSLILALVICLSLCACGNSEEQMRDKFSNLTARMVEMNRQCDILTPGVMEIWNNVGGDHFWGSFKYVIQITSAEEFEAIIDDLTNDENYNPDQKRNRNQIEWIIGSLVGNAFDDDFNDDNPVPLKESKKAFLLEKSIPLAIAYNNLSQKLDPLQDEVSQFVKDYKEKYPDEASVLKEWMLETIAYAEHVMSPSGTYADYQNQSYEYQRNVARFYEEAEFLK